MALINKIRQKTGLAVGIVAFGLGLFVVGGDVIGPNSVIMGKNKTDVGEIAGHTVELEEYQNQVDEFKANYSMQGRTPSEAEMYSIRQQAWDYLIVKTAFEQEYDKLGVRLTEEEQIDMVQGDNVHSYIKSLFTNPETGVFDKNRLIATLQTLKDMPPQERAMWNMIEQQLIPSRKRIKYDNLLVKSVYVSEAEAKQAFVDDNTIAEIEYLYVPNYTVTDSIDVTDADLEKYFAAHKAEYKVEDGRSISYVKFPILPSADDSAYVKEEMGKIAVNLKETKEDSLYARMNSDADDYFGTYTIDMLPSSLQANHSNLSVNDVRGPYYANEAYNLYKISDIFTDTTYAARASHILIKWADNSDAAKSEARSTANEVLRKAQSGSEFGDLAREYSVDGTASVGGDLGWFSTGRMVKPFEDAVFSVTKPGLINKVVESQFGFHIIKVTEPKNNKHFKVAKVSRKIIPSEVTRDVAYRKADLFAGTSANYDEFKKNAEMDSLVVLNALNLGKNERRFNDLTDAREVIRWCYNEAKVNKVSSVFEVEDFYVVAVLTQKRDEGYAKLEDVKDQIRNKVYAEKQSEVIINKLKSLSGSLSEIKDAYGVDARVQSSSNLKFSSNNLPGVGFAPVAVGKAFGLENGQKTEPFAVENGVVIIEMKALTPTADIADYSTYKTQIEQRVSNRVSYDAAEVIREFADIQDHRYRFF